MRTWIPIEYVIKYANECFNGGLLLLSKMQALY